MCNTRVHIPKAFKIRPSIMQASGFQSGTHTPLSCSSASAKNNNNYCWVRIWLYGRLRMLEWIRRPHSILAYYFILMRARRRRRLPFSCGSCILFQARLLIIGLFDKWVLILLYADGCRSVGYMVYTKSIIGRTRQTSLIWTDKQAGTFDS